MTRLDLAHEHPRFTALRSLAEDTPPAGPRGPDAAFPPQEEAAELLTNVADDPAEPLRRHKETPKTSGDVKVARKVMTRADAFPKPCLESGSALLMQMCALNYLPQGRGEQRDRGG